MIRVRQKASGKATFMYTLCEAFFYAMTGQFIASSKTGDESGVHLQYLESPNVGILLLSGTGGA